MAYEHLGFAVAYADAKGLPYETKSKQEIIELGGVSESLILPVSFCGSFPDFIGRPIGTWSDDTQHTLAMMRTITDREKFDLVDLAKNLKNEYEISAAGWGGATKSAMERVGDDMDIDELRLLGIESTGCGPLMRLGPLALYQTLKGNRIDADLEIVDSTTLTHGSNDAISVSLTLAALMRELATNPDVDTVNTTIKNARYYEKMMSVQPRLSQRLERVQDTDDISSVAYEYTEEGKDDSFAIWSVATAVITGYERNKRNFYEMIDSVIAEGGDTDSTAAIAASLFVIANPDFKIHTNIVEQLDRSGDLNMTGKNFSEFLS